MIINVTKRMSFIIVEHGLDLITKVLQPCLQTPHIFWMIQISKMMVKLMMRKWPSTLI
jgi:hypothetical protein